MEAARTTTKVIKIRSQALLFGGEGEGESVEESVGESVGISVGESVGESIGESIGEIVGELSLAPTESDSV